MASRWRAWIKGLGAMALGLPLVLGALAMPDAAAAPRSHARSTQIEPSAGQGRVIVKFRSGSALVQALAVRPEAGPQQAAALGARLGMSLHDGHAMSARMQVMTASGLSSQALAARLATDANVEWAAPDERRVAAKLPNDPLFAAGQASPYPAVGQWYLRGYSAADPTDNPLAAINAVGAWDTTLGAASVVVAVIDTGVRADHPDLAGRFLPGYNMISLNTAQDGNAAGQCITGNGSCRTNNPTDPSDPGDWVTQADVNNYPTLFNSSCIGDSSWHGTQVSGIVGASTDNSLGMAGIASGAMILPVRVLGKCGGYDSDIIDGMNWAAGLPVAGVPTNPHPARVLNLSLGGSGACTSAYQATIDALTARGVVVVVAAGNDGLAVGAPGNCSGVVTVGGLRHTGTKVGYSDLGPAVTLSAPAGNCVNASGACLYPIVTTFNAGTTTPVANDASYTDGLSHPSLGTSFSTPQVAGTAALMLSVNPGMSSAQVTATLTGTASPFPSTGAGAGVSACLPPSGTAQTSECYCTTSTCGAGMLNAAAAVAAAAAANQVQPAFSVTPASPRAGDSVTLDGSASQVAAGHTVATWLWEITSAGTTGAAFTSATNGATATFGTTAAGQVTVRLTVTDNLGSQASAVQTLTIAAPAGTGQAAGGGSSGSGGSGGGGAWSPLWALGLLACGWALPPRRRRSLPAAR